MKALPNWRAVRLWETQLERELHQRHSLRIHGFFIGTLMLVIMLFGFDALLAVAIEVAFSYTAARTVVRVSREGWLGAAVRLTWKPLLGALACAVVLGLSIDHFLPQAKSLP